jgi:transcriptional regulator with XRE-family HTH domain
MVQKSPVKATKITRHEYIFRLKVEISTQLNATLKLAIKGQFNQRFFMSHPVDIHVGRKLKQIRTLRRLSQTDVAKKLNLSFQQIQKYEIGSNRVAASRLFELAQILDVPPSYFFEGLHDNSNTAPAKDAGMEIVTALAAIKDEAVKTRIKTFIEDVSGVTVARRG